MHARAAVQQALFLLKIEVSGDLLAGKEMEWIVDYEVGFPKELEP